MRIAFLGDQLRLRSSRARHLRALAGLQLDVVDRSAGRDVAQRQRITHQNIGLGTADDLGAHLESHRIHDVALLTIGVVQQGDTRRAIGIVLDGGDGRRNSELVALEVDDAQLALVSPPWCQMVRSPELRRPPVRCLGSVSGLYGRFVVRSSLTVLGMNRRDGVTGL